MLRREAQGRGLGRELAGQLLRSLGEAGFARAGARLGGGEPRAGPLLALAGLRAGRRAGDGRGIQAYHRLQGVVNIDFAKENRHGYE